MAKRNLDKTGSEQKAPERRRRTTTPTSDATKSPAATRSRGRRNTDVVAQASTAPVEPLAGTPDAAPASLTAEAAVEAPVTAAPSTGRGAGGNGHANHVDVPHEQIALRAYHLYLERGGQPGDQFLDWVTAERQLREQFARPHG